MAALQQYKEFDWDNYRNNAYDCTVTTPVLLMEDVAYACCGRNDVVALKTDGTVWTMGNSVENKWLCLLLYLYAQKDSGKRSLGNWRMV